MPDDDWEHGEMLEKGQMIERSDRKHKYQHHKEYADIGWAIVILSVSGLIGYAAAWQLGLTGLAAFGIGTLLWGLLVGLYATVAHWWAMRRLDGENDA